MKTKGKKRVSPLLKVLLSIEVICIVLLITLCGFKDRIPLLADMFDKEVVDVVLDAGHGGFDSGCVSGDLYEKDINLQVTLQIGKQLESAGYKVSYTRDSDNVDWADEEMGDLRYRTKVSNNSGAKLFVSIHVNSEEVDYGSYGYEVWGQFDKAEVERLGTNILDSVDTLGYSLNRGMKDQDVSPLHVLQNNQVAAVLFELGFINSDIDQRHLIKGYSQTQMSNKIAEGIKKTLDEIKKEEELKEKEKS
ncbi:N-acetylmuramoyl-L-alanine amidase [Amedibacillus sp. YH-ame6]